MRKTLAICIAFCFGLLASPLITSGQSMQETELFIAAAGNDTDTIDRLLGQDVDIDARDSEGRTALLAATHANAIEAAQVLIEAGADVNAKDRIDDSHYLYAGARCHLQILKMTLVHGVDLKSTNRFGGTAL